MIKSGWYRFALVPDMAAETPTMVCPKCQSSDVTRSRRKFWERIVLYFLRAQVYRCRDCRKRYWIGVEWGNVILGTLTAVVVTGVIATIVVVHRNQAQLAPAQPKIPVRRRQRLPPLPKGLPPLSSVPYPATGTDTTNRKQDKSVTGPRP